MFYENYVKSKILLIKIGRNSQQTVISNSSLNMKQLTKNNKLSFTALSENISTPLICMNY